jgi:hypothetical protein
MKFMAKSVKHKVKKNIKVQYSYTDCTMVNFYCDFISYFKQTNVKCDASSESQFWKFQNIS